MALTGFWGCRKDTITSTTNESVANANATIPEVFKISVDDVKAWYKGGLPTEAELNGLQTRSERTKTPLGIIPIFPTAFQTIGQYSDSTYRGPIQEVITPIYKDGRIEMDAKQGSFMLFHRDSKGQIQSKLVVFYVDEDAYLDPQKIVTNLTFTGRSVTVDENDNIVSFERLVDGKIVEKGSVSVPFKSTINGFASGGLTTRDDCPGPGDCFNWKKSWWAKLWDGIVKVATSVFGGDDNAKNNDSVGSLGTIGNDSTPLVWQPANSTGGTATTDVGANYCQALQSSFSDDQLQAFLDGEVPISRVGGVVTPRDIENLKFRNRLRELIADGFPCREDVYPLSQTPQFADCAYNYFKSKNKSLTAKNYITDVTRHVYQYPADRDLVNEYGCLYIEEYGPAGFEIEEFLEIVKDPDIFLRINEFLKRNNFNPLAVSEVKKNRPLVKKANNASKKDGVGRINATTCPESFLFVKVGDGFTTNVQEVSHSYLCNWFTVYSYCIPNMCIQVSGKDKFGQPLTSDKASELTAYAMDNARLEMLADLDIGQIASSASAKLLFRVYFQDELIKLTGGSATCSISNGACSGNKIPGEFIYMKSPILTLNQCIQIKCN